MTSAAKTLVLLQKAVALHQQGKLGEADDLYKKILKAQPAHVDALHLSGVVAGERGRYRDAITLYDRALNVAPAFADIHFNKGNALSALGENDTALAAYARAIALQPLHVDARLNSGLLLHRVGRRDDAIALFREMTRLAPADPRGHYNLGICLTELYPTKGIAERQPIDIEAKAAFDRSLALSPNDPQVHFAHGNYLSARGEHEKAAAAVRLAIKLKPDWSDAWGNLAGHLEGSGDRAGAVAAFDEALRLNPANAAAAVNRGVTLLALGQMEEGWNGYGRRFEDPRFPFVNRPWPWKKWNGERLAGKRILIWSDQGVGDEILYASMIDEMAKLGACVVECTPRLVPIYRRSFGGVEIVPNEPATHAALLAQHFDFHSSVLDIGKWRRPSLQRFPNKSAYLRADGDRAREVRKRYGAPGRKLIGLSWRSANPTIGPEKSLQLSDFAPLFQSARDAVFVNVQYGDSAREAAQARDQFGINLISDSAFNSLHDLDGFAAQLAALDCLVTVSNTAAHLAAALGVPTYLYVPNGRKRLWYWFDEGFYSPWYPSVRIYRGESAILAADVGKVVLA